MALIVPAGVDAEGAVKVAFVPTLADPAAPKLTEITAVGALDISCYLTKDGFGVGGEDEKGTDERLCTKEVFETLGKTRYTIENLIYIYDAQNAGSDSNKAYELMKRGTGGYLVVRWGGDAQTDDFAVGDVVDVYPVTLGEQFKQRPEANSKLKVSQGVIVSGPVEPDVALAA